MEHRMHEYAVLDSVGRKLRWLNGAHAFVVYAGGAIALTGTLGIANPVYAAGEKAGQSELFSSASAGANETVLQDVVVRGTKRKKVADAQQETAASTRMTLTAAQLQKFAGLSGLSSGALEYVPGVHAAGDDSSGLQGGSFTIRGFDDSEFGDIRDGVPLNDPVYQQALNDFEGDPENYESLTVIPGSSPIGAPSLTSSGGSIIITTVDPTSKPDAFFKEGFGSNNLFRTFTRLNTGAIGDFSAWVSFSHVQSSLWTQSPGKEQMQREEFNLQYENPSGVKVNLIASNMTFNESFAFNPTLAQYETLPYDATWQGPSLIPGPTANSPWQVGGSLAQLHRGGFTNQTFGLPIEIPITDNVTLSINPYYVHGGGTGSIAVAAVPLSPTQVVALGVMPPSHRSGVTTHIDWYLADQNTLQFGLWYDHTQAVDQEPAFNINADGSSAGQYGGGIVVNANGDKLYFSNQHDTINANKYWVQDSWNFLPKWNLTPGLAWQDTYNKGNNIPAISSPDPITKAASYFTLLPRLSLSYRPNDPNQIYYDVATNVRPPAIASVYAATKQAAETAVNQELGWRYSTSNILIDTALFYDLFHNRQASYSPNGVVTDYFNAGNVTTQGIQASVHGQLPYDFHYQASWLYVNSAQQENYTANGSIADTKGKQLYDTPNDIGTLGFGYDDGTLYGDIVGHYTSSFYGDLENTEKIDGYGVVDLDLGYRFKIRSLAVNSGTVSVNVNNLLDNHYLSGVASGSVSANPDSPFYVAPEYYRGEPLSVVANLSFDFE